MIEAINSVLANAPLLRGNAEQQSSLRDAVTAEEAIESIKQYPKAPFVSPHVSVDSSYGEAVLQIRDSDTGDVLRQFPSESTLESRARAERIQQFQESLALLSGGSGEVEQVSSSDSAPTSQFTGEVVSFGQSDRASSAAVSSGGSGPSLDSAQIASRALSASAGVGQPSSQGSVSLTA